MASNGFGYYYGKSLLDSSNVLGYYSFNSGSTVIPVESGNPLYYISLVGNTGQFYNYPGSGFFSGTVGKVNSGNLIDKSDFSSLIIFDKFTTGSQVILSTLNSGVFQTSGFAFGVNAANKAYVTSYDTSGLASTNTFNLPLSKKNLVLLSKDGNAFSLSKYNFSENQFYEDRISFPNASLTEGLNYYLGGISGAQSIDNPFIGAIDEFVLFEENVDLSSLKQAISGFYTSAPTLSYGITNSENEYAYDNLTGISSGQFDSVTSGLLEYIQDNIFNITGVGDITVVSSGVVVGNVASISGYLSGTVELQSGYYILQSGQLVTGYSSSGLVPSATGITGYSLINLNPFVSYSGANSGGDVYSLSGLSGLTGVTEYESVFTGPIYQTVYTPIFVEDTSGVSYYQTFNYTVTGSLTGTIAYVDEAIFSNNGSDKIVITHDLTYSGYVQPTPFRIFKSTYLDYGDIYIENLPDETYKRSFYMDGVTLTNPLSGKIELVSVNQTALGGNLFNVDSILNLSSGKFKTNQSLTATDISYNVNGINQLSGHFSGDPILDENGDYVLDESYNIIFADIISGDYAYISKYFQGNLVWDRLDNSVYDYLSGFGVNRYVGESSSGYVSGATFSATPNDYWFINGQKLISGADYTYSSNLITLRTNQFSGMNSTLWSVYPSYTVNSSFRTGNSMTGIFDERTSQVYLNGVRQRINDQYVETSRNDLIYNISGFDLQSFDTIFTTKTL